MYCKHCGKKITDDSIFCTYCGGKVGEKASEQKVPAVKPGKPSFLTSPDGNEKAAENPDKTGETEAAYAGPAAGQAVEQAVTVDEPRETGPYGRCAYEDYTRPVKAAGKENIFSKAVLKTGPLPFILLAFILAVRGQAAMFNGANHIKTGLVFFALGIAAFVMAEYSRRLKLGQDPLSQPQDFKAGPVKFKYELVLFMLVLVTAVFFRVYKADVIPSGFFYDEAAYGDAAYKIINNQPVDGVKLPVYIKSLNHAAYYMYVVGAAFKFFGTGMMQERMVSALMGVLGTLAFYFLLRSMFGAPMAFFGGILLAATRWHVIFSRSAFLASFGVFVAVVCIYAAWKVYKDRKTVDFFLFGLSAALVAYTYIPARMVYPALLVFMAYIAIRDRKFYTQNLKKIILAAAVFFVVFLPLIMVFLHSPQDFTNRISQVSLLDKSVVDHWFNGKFTVAQALKDTFEKTFLMFNHAGDFNPRHNLPGYPELDFLTGTAAVLGFGFALVYLFHPANFLAVALFISFMIPGLVTIESPQAHRLIFTVPVIIFFVCIFLHKFMAYAKSQYGGRFRGAAAALVLLFVVCASWLNFDVYFNKQTKSSSCWDSFNTQERTAYEYILKKDASWRGIVDPLCIGKSFYFIMDVNKNRNYSVFDENTSMPIKAEPGLNYVYLLMPDKQVLVDYTLKELYPNGRMIKIYNGADKNVVHMLAYEVPAADAIAKTGYKIKNGLTARYYSGYKWEGGPRVTSIVPVIYFDWHITPVQGYFSAIWSGKIIIPRSGTYRFITRSNNYNIVNIDGKKVVENRTRASIIEAGGEANLRAGKHNIEVKYAEDSGYSKMQMLWQQPDMASPEVIPYNSLLPE